MAPKLSWLAEGGDGSTSATFVPASAALIDAMSASSDVRAASAKLDAATSAVCAKMSLMPRAMKTQSGAAMLLSIRYCPKLSAPPIQNGLPGAAALPLKVIVASPAAPLVFVNVPEDNGAPPLVTLQRTVPAPPEKPSRD
ncbi:hypothetical protein D3C71_1612730 [compost metagenome]